MARASSSSVVLHVHLRTDANDVVAPTSTTQLSGQQETIHMLNQLRHEACSGALHDLAHVVSGLFV
eukprot:7424215-Prorocentrum_lima.AAC.1